MREITIYNYDAELVEDNNVRTIINIYDKDNDRRLYVIIIPKELKLLLSVARLQYIKIKTLISTSIRFL